MKDARRHEIFNLHKLCLLQRRWLLVTIKHFGQHHTTLAQVESSRGESVTRSPDHVLHPNNTMLSADITREIEAYNRQPDTRSSLTTTRFSLPVGATIRHKDGTALTGTPASGKMSDYHDILFNKREALYLRGGGVAGTASGEEQHAVILLQGPAAKPRPLLKLEVCIPRRRAVTDELIFTTVLGISSLEWAHLARAGAAGHTCQFSICVGAQGAIVRAFVKGIVHDPTDRQFDSWVCGAAERHVQHERRLIVHKWLNAASTSIERICKVSHALLVPPTSVPSAEDTLLLQTALQVPLTQLARMALFDMITLSCCFAGIFAAAPPAVDAPTTLAHILHDTTMLHVCIHALLPSVARAQWLKLLRGITSELQMTIAGIMTAVAVSMGGTGHSTDFSLPCHDWLTSPCPLCHGSRRVAISSKWVSHMTARTDSCVVPSSVSSDVSADGGTVECKSDAVADRLASEPPMRPLASSSSSMRGHVSWPCWGCTCGKCGAALDFVCQVGCRGRHETSRDDV